MQEARKGAGPRLLTFQQMEQIRFLRQTDPDEWDIQSLAHSFQVPELVIHKVLKNKVLPKSGIQEKLDNRARANHRISHKSSNTSTQVESSLTVKEDSQPLSKKRQWGLPEWQNLGWFSGYESAGLTSNIKGNEQHRKSPESRVQWLDDDECEFYEDLYQSVEDDGDDVDSHSEEHALEVSTNDGRAFYSGDELLYKI